MQEIRYVIENFVRMKRQTQRFRDPSTRCVSFNELENRCDLLFKRDDVQICFELLHPFKPIFTFQFTQGMLLKLKNFIEHAHFTPENCFFEEELHCNMGLLGSFEQATLESTYSSAVDTPSSAKQLTIIEKLACLKKSGSIEFEADEAISSSRCSDTPRQRMMHEFEIEEFTSSDVQESHSSPHNAVEVDLSGPISLHQLPQPPQPAQPLPFPPFSADRPNIASCAEKASNLPTFMPGSADAAQIDPAEKAAPGADDAEGYELSDDIKISQNTLRNLENLLVAEDGPDDFTRDSDDYQDNSRGSLRCSLPREDFSGLSDTAGQFSRGENKEEIKRYVRAPGVSRLTPKSKFQKSSLGLEK